MSRFYISNGAVPGLRIPVATQRQAAKGRQSEVLSEAQAIARGRKLTATTGTAIPPIGSKLGYQGFYLPLVSDLLPIYGMYTGDAAITPSFVANTAFGDSINGHTAWVGSGRAILLTGARSALSFGVGDFTIEFWFNDIVVNSLGGILGMRVDNSTQPTLIVQPGSFDFFNGSHCIIPARVDGTGWHHFSFCRSGGSLRTFRDGVLVDTRGLGDLTCSINDPRIGMADNGGGGHYYLGGNLQQFVVVKGFAARSASFTPPNYL